MFYTVDDFVHLTYEEVENNIIHELEQGIGYKTGLQWDYFWSIGLVRYASSLKKAIEISERYPAWWELYFNWEGESMKFYIQCESCLEYIMIHDEYNNEDEIDIKIIGESVVEITCKSCGNSITAIHGKII